MSTGQKAHLGELSHGLWGNQDRLVVALAVAEADPADLFAQALGEKIGIPDKRVGPQLKRFVELGLLVRLPQAGGDRRVYHQRANEPFWESVRAMAKALAE